ncbi:MAG: trypsin-like peptidase domain-containing protein [Cyanobacteriota bacterium]|nr:trypsin-like peptidase domain-containing protein [Cyanobacteriota bacterium]
MVKLEPEDRKQLIAALKDVDELKNERSRLETLRNSGLEKIATNIDLSGAPSIAISQMVSYLSNYGRLSYDREALGQFLNSLLESGVFGIEKGEFISQLLNKYEMMEPVVTAPKIDEWRGKETPASVYEKIIGENTLRPIAFLAQGMKVAKSVVYIGVRTGDSKSAGTGFMVAPNLLLTNNHVLPYAELLQTSLFRFNYEENFLGEAQAVSEYRGKAGGIFHTNINLDYSLVEIEGEPGKEWGYLPLAARDVRVNNRVNIIQHPMGQPKQISMQNNFVQYVGKNVVQYVTSTQPGSSGSPVFNDNWEVVALHHSGGNIPEPATGKKYYRNEGIWIGSILKDLPEELKKLLAN